MRAMVHAEFWRVWSTRSWMWMTGLAALLSSLDLIGVVTFRSAGAAFVATPAELAHLGTTSYLFLAVLGALMFTGDSKHGTADATFLICPSRSRAVVCRAVAAFLAGALLGFALTLVTVGIGAVVYTLVDLRVSFDTAIVGIVIRQVIALGGVTALGLALGALIRHQLSAILFLVVWLIAAEAIVLALLPDALRDYGIGSLYQQATGGVHGLWALAVLASYVLGIAALAAIVLEFTASGSQ